jgi:predicted nucleic acid-binding protein
MVVIDTNVLVDVLRGTPGAIEALTELADVAVVVPTMVRFEVLAGARRREMSSIMRLLDECIDAPVDASVADAAATFARRSGRSHTGIDPIDYVVAATAQLLEAQLLTRNVKHFPMFPKLRAPY